MRTVMWKSLERTHTHIKSLKIMQRNMVGVWWNVGYRLDHRWPAHPNGPKPSHLLSWDRKSGRETHVLNNHSCSPNALVFQSQVSVELISSGTRNWSQLLSHLITLDLETDGIVARGSQLFSWPTNSARTAATLAQKIWAAHTTSTTSYSHGFQSCCFKETTRT
jgi:hypothetical protein